jgi:hypothetical protein
LELEPTPSNHLSDEPVHAHALDVLDVIEMTCIRCREPAAMRFYGMCSRCTDELHAKYDISGREIAAEEYTPKVNVTPNAVALKDD